ncbi:MAG: porin [Rhizobiales bacterium]|nr:porin [Hyphomicrobiales bacterium]
MDCTIFRAAIVVLITLSEAASSGVTAQTLIEPNAKPKLSRPPGSAKQQPALRTKSCSTFGAGFVQIPGTDTCVKIGGFVTMEGAVNRGR